MKVLVISDSHENSPLVFRAVDLAAPLDAVIHLGDGSADAELLGQALEVPLIRVAGNCDYESDAPRELVWECQGKRLLLLHGDRYGVKTGLERLERHAVQLGVDAVLFGHSHAATVVTRSGILFVNPGTLIRSSAAKSFAIVEISSDSITARLYPIS